MSTDPKLGNGDLKVGDDAFHARGVAGQNIASRMVLPTARIADRYNAGQVDIHIHLGTSLEKPDGELVFRAIPSVQVKLDDAASALRASENWPRGGSKRDSMFSGICELTKSDKIVSAAGVFIASRIWLQAPESFVQRERVSRFSVSFGNVSELKVQIVGMRGDGEVNVTNIPSLDSSDGGASGMIEGVFDVPKGVTGKLAQFLRNGGHAHLKEYVSGLRIRLDEMGVRVASYKGLASGVELLNVFASPTDKGAGA